MERGEIKARLTDIGSRPEVVLTEDQREFYEQLIYVGEYGLGLEMLADWMSEDLHPISAGLRSEARSLAQAMGNEARVMGPLAMCPDDSESPTSTG